MLNPYYRHMGGLYGSEYWTYLMPRRIGRELTEELTSAPFEPIGTRRAVQIGLLEDAFGEDVPRFRGQVRALATELAGLPYLETLLEAKRHARRRDEQIKPLSAYRTEELAKSHEGFVTLEISNGRSPEVVGNSSDAGRLNGSLPRLVEPAVADALPLAHARQMAEHVR